MSPTLVSSSEEHSGITRASIQEQVGRILAGKDFVNAPQRSMLLKFIVEYALQNGGKGPKETTIADECLRIKDFDPLVDTKVRKGASEPRKHLKEYYEHEVGTMRS